MSSRLIIIDQSLNSFEGHHYDYSRAVIEAARTQGFDVSLACHRGFPAESLAGAPVVGRFSADWNAANRSSIRALLRGVLARAPSSVRNGLLALTAARAGSTVPSATPNPHFARALLAILAEAKFKEGDHVFIHTLGDAEFLGLIEVLARERPVPAYFHVVLRYDGTEACRDAFASLGTLPARLNFWTDTELLASHYRDLGCPDMGVLPIPHGLPAIPERKQQDGAPLTLAYLGGARGDKGFHLLPDLVATLADHHLATGRGRFLIQTNYAFSREEPLMAQTKRALARFPRSWVELIEAPLDPAAFAQALFATDLLLLPYDSEVFARRSSGLLVQAMVAGIPTVVPEATWLATEAPEGAHVVCGGGLTVADAVRRAIANYDALSAAARAAAPQARKKHDIARLVGAVTLSTRKPGLSNLMR